MLVNKIGVSISPSSTNWVLPAILPYPLPTSKPAGTFSWKIFPRWGKTAVTPVRISSPSMSVTCPTRTPATSVMPLKGPGWKIPGAMPKARARCRLACFSSNGRESFMPILYWIYSPPIPPTREISLLHLQKKRNRTPCAGARPPCLIQRPPRLRPQTRSMSCWPRLPSPKEDRNAAP